MSKKKKITSYTTALEELQIIMDALQSEAVGIDELSTQIERASELIQYCRDKLRGTEDRVQKILGQEE